MIGWIVMVAIGIAVVPFIIWLQCFQFGVAAKCSGSRETSVRNSHEFRYSQLGTALAVSIAKIWLPGETFLEIDTIPIST